MKWIVAKLLEGIGTLVLIVALLNGLGLTRLGEPNLGKEIFLGFIGILFLFMGAWLEFVPPKKSVD